MLADIHDGQKFSEHLLQLVENDELRNRMGSGSHEHVMSRYSYQRLVNDMSQLYYELLDKKRR